MGEKAITVDEPVVADTPASVLETNVKTAVEQWINSHLRDSPFSQNTPAWNHFVDGLPALVKGIVKEVEGK
jgi:hypothetical protein